MEDKSRPRDKSLFTTIERTGNIPGTMNRRFEMLQRGMRLKILEHANSYVHFEDDAQTGRDVRRMHNNLKRGQGTGDDAREARNHSGILSGNCYNRNDWTESDLLGRRHLQNVHRNIGNNRVRGFEPSALSKLSMWGSQCRSHCRCYEPLSLVRADERPSSDESDDRNGRSKPLEPSFQGNLDKMRNLHLKLKRTDLL